MNRCYFGLESQHIGFDGNIANVGTDSNSAVGGLAQRFGLSHVFFNNIAQSNVTACVHKRLAKASAHGAVGVPVITASATPLEFARWSPGVVMVEGAFKAHIPADIEWMIPEIVIVPLVAWDETGGRLGYGGGFYDRTLEGLRARGPVLAIGFAFNVQQAYDLPLEVTDQPLDMIVTEDRVLTIGD